MEMQPKIHSDDFGKLLIRIAVAGLMIFHGYSKITNGIEWLIGMLQQKGIPGFFAYGVYVAEVLAPILIFFGIWTRLAALVVAFDMAMAIGLTGGGHIFSIKEMGGGFTFELEAFFLLCSLALFFMGGGRISILRNKWS